MKSCLEETTEMNIRKEQKEGKYRKNKIKNERETTTIEEIGRKTYRCKEKQVEIVVEKKEDKMKE